MGSPSAVRARLVTIKKFLCVWQFGGKPVFPSVMDNFPDKMFWIGLKSFIKSFSEFYCSELEINLVKLYFAVDSIKIKILLSIISSQWKGCRRETERLKTSNIWLCKVEARLWTKRQNRREIYFDEIDKKYKSSAESWIFHNSQFLFLDSFLEYKIMYSVTTHNTSHTFYLFPANIVDLFFQGIFQLEWGFCISSTGSPNISIL